MNRPVVPPTELQSVIRERIEKNTLYATAADLKLNKDTVRKIAQGRPVSKSTLCALEGVIAFRASPKVREASEFRTGTPRLRPPRRLQSVFTWTLESIRAARDAQLRGQFDVAYDLSVAMNTDDAIFVARGNRSAPQSALACEFKPAPGARGEAVCKRALQGIVSPRTVMGSINRTFADHGIAFGHNIQRTSEDGSVVYFEHEEWPIKFVQWDESLECWTTQVRDGIGRVPIVHGDGEWVVYAKSAHEPHRKDAAILPGALIYAVHALGLRSWGKGADAHGNSKVLGRLAEGVPTHKDDGSLTEEADEFLGMLSDIMSDGDQLAGLIPFGYEADFINNMSPAHAIFRDLIENREKAAHRVWLGTDAALGSVGGAPGVDIAALFGVATTIIQGDLEVLQRCWRSGVSEPWTAINEGDSRYAPSLEYQMPDADADAKRKSQVEASEAFYRELESLKKNGFELNQPTVDAIAAKHGLEPVPQLAKAGNSTTFILGVDAVKAVVRGSEARASQGLPPFGDARDDLTIAEIEARAAAAATPAPTSPAPAAVPAATDAPPAVPQPA